MSCTIRVIGNIQLDVLASPVSALPTPGGDTVVERIAVRTAGAAGNVALALAALGARHRLFGTVGDDDAGRWVVSELERLGLQKDIKLHERLKAQYRFEAFNAFNRVTLLSPNNTRTSGNFLKITEADSPRILQFALRFAF